MQEMKNCQFCGSDDQKVVSFSSGANSPVSEHYVICDNCGAQGPIGVNSELAIKKWNSRIQEVTQEILQLIKPPATANMQCPIRNGFCNGANCMMWIWVGEDKGRCGLVNTMFIDSTGCSVV